MLPQAVVGALDKILQGEAHTWCAGGRITAAIIADGLPPPQCLLDFLDGGGSADAHPPSEDAFSQSTLLQLASRRGEGVFIGALSGLVGGLKRAEGGELV